MKSKTIIPVLGWIIIVLVILGFFAYLAFGSGPRIAYDPNIITVTEGTQGFRNDLRIGVSNIQNGSGIIYVSSKTDNLSENVKTGDNFDFQNYHIQVIEVKENTRILPTGLTGGSNGSITLKISAK